MSVYGTIDRWFGRTRRRWSLFTLTFENRAFTVFLHRDRITFDKALVVVRFSNQYSNLDDRIHFCIGQICRGYFAYFDWISCSTSESSGSARELYPIIWFNRRQILCIDFLSRWFVPLLQYSVGRNRVCSRRVTETWSPNSCHKPRWTTVNKNDRSKNGQRWTLSQWANIMLKQVSQHWVLSKNGSACFRELGKENFQHNRK